MRLRRAWHACVRPPRAARPAAVSSPVVVFAAAVLAAQGRFKQSRGSVQGSGERSMQQRCTVKALRGSAAPSSGSGGIGLSAHAASAVAAARSAQRAVAGLWPNPSIERTHNGGAQRRASEALVAPLCAAHVER